MFDQFKQQLPDVDAQETGEWVEALDQVVERQGPERARFIFYRLLKRARMLGVGLPPTTQTRYINTISPEQELDYPGDERMEKRIRRLIRWNAAVMVTRANHVVDGLGGHMSTYASSASLYEVGFNHFFRGKDGNQPGDAIYIQGHGAPGVYARAFLEGRLGQEQLDYFRRESTGKGLSSYPHPRLMPEFWEYPTVSMGLGPINAIYHARFLRYMESRGLIEPSDAKVWCFLGDGETDEPESLGAIGLASREGLDNLIFVINCNLQRLDGPVRGNGKIIQELEGSFKGAGWNVIKVIWGREWDDLLKRDYEGALVRQMNETLDGEFQRLAAESGDYIREKFFDDPELKALVSHLPDEELPKLRRGGHDIRKIYNAYAAAVSYKHAPTCILAKTVKGWTLGEKFEGRNPTHQIKKMSEEELKKFRDRLELEVTDKQIEDIPPYHHPGPNSPEIQYLHERRKALHGTLPQRRTTTVNIPLPQRSLYEEFHGGTGDGPAVSTTMAFVRLLRKLLKDKELGKHIVPIVPDEARTFGMEGLFREFKLYAALGQKYEPLDAKMLLSYSESKDGQILEEGITEAGSMASFTASGTSYATMDFPTIPFFIFYSMFGFQRVGDLVWAAADSRARGFMLGATAGRTTLNGEGLQHQDGHSIVLASTNPACVVYDPAFAYEIAVIIEDGMHRMYENGEDVIYYLTVYNENYKMPPMPEEDVREGILKGIYKFRGPSDGRKKAKARILGSGSIMMQALAAQEKLEALGIPTEVWSVTSYVELRREALEVERQNRLNWDEAERRPYVSTVLDGEIPTIAVSDYMKSVPDMIRPWVPGAFHSLGTDGFGRSDTREALRRFFEIDAEHVALTALVALYREGGIDSETLREGISELGLEPGALDAVPKS